MAVWDCRAPGTGCETSGRYAFVSISEHVVVSDVAGEIEDLGQLESARIFDVGQFWWFGTLNAGHVVS